MSEEQRQKNSTEVVPPTEDVPSTTNTKAEPPTQQDVKDRDGEISRAENHAGQEDGEDGDSEAETLIQSPEKKRSIVETAPLLQPTNGGITSINVSSAPAKDVQSRKRKRSVNEGQRGARSPILSRRSSPLSSPAAHVRSGDESSDESSRKRFKSSKRNGGHDQSPESATSSSQKRKHSDAADQSQSYRRDKRSMDSGERRETRSATYPRPSDDERSPSPHLSTRREHRRGASTQLTAHEFERKKRGRPPLINTRRHRSAERTGSPDSDEDSPAPLRSSLHKLTSVDNDTMSPAKTGPRKWRDKNGRTWVARAANNDDLEGVRAKLVERPGDLDLADNAGNSPLQIAALEGFVDIVEYLLKQGCDVDSRNIDKDTPLIDAVENGHLEVIKLLLSYGANPRLGNAKGDEPYELVPQDDENYIEIRKLLADAKERDSSRHGGQNQNDLQEPEGRSSSQAASAASPRDSPPAGPRSPPAAASRRRTGRSESTRNDLLWQANTQENLTKLAGKGDTQGVASILNILQKASTESLIAAAKAGHNDVLQYLLAMGEPEIDPEPIRHFNPGYNTPLLAAIGRGHVDVVKLLVNQPDFNPTRKVMGKTYFDFAEERKGQEWQREYEVLKAAHDRFVTVKPRKQTSPRKTRDLDKARARPARRSSSPVAGKMTSTSPTMTHKSLPTKSTDSSPRERRKVNDVTDKTKTTSHRGDVLDSSSIAVLSDLDQTVTNSKKVPRPRRSQSDLPPARTMANDAPYRRRRLVTGKEHRRNKSTAPGSASEDDSTDMIEVKQEDRRTPTLKRMRNSRSPEPKHTDDGEKTKAGTKKRRMVESSPEEARALPTKFLPHEATARGCAEANEVNNSKTEAAHITDGVTTDSPRPVLTNTTNIVNTEPPVESIEAVTTGVETGASEASDKVNEIGNEQNQQDLPMSDLQSKVPNLTASTKEVTSSNPEDAPETQSLHITSIVPEQDEQVLDKESHASRQSAEVFKKAFEAAAAERASLEEAQKQAAKVKEIEIAEKARRQAELAAIQQAESEAIARRKEEEAEQMRLQIAYRLRQEDEEKERQRIAGLPATLARCAIMINKNDPLVRSEKWLRKKFAMLWLVETQQMDPNASPEVAKQEWLPNFQVAGLLGTKDLSLKSYTTLETRPATAHERYCMWRFARWHLQYDDLMRNQWKGPRGEECIRYEQEQKDKFMQLTDIFWVKLATFLDLVPQHPHLLGLDMPTLPCSLRSYAATVVPDVADATGKSTSTPANAAAPLMNGTHTNGVTHHNGE